MNKPLLAIVVPCYNEQSVLQISKDELLAQLVKLIQKKLVSEDSYICFVDDGSKDETWKIIKDLSLDKHIKGLKLSRNFGHQKALLAGLRESNADIYITIDADLQDDIEKIEEMVEKYIHGYDIVYGVRNDRKSDSFVKSFCAKTFYKVSKLLGVKAIEDHADYRLVSNNVVELLRKSTETNIYLRGLIPSLGFNSAKIYYSRLKRIGGSAKYNFFSSLSLAIDGITSFSVAPLRLIAVIGFIVFVVAILMSFYSIYAYFEKGVIPGWASLFVSVYFLGGIQLLSIGIIGEYIGKIYIESKGRPLYVVETKV